jgi:hypothetical protein
MLIKPKSSFREASFEGLGGRFPWAVKANRVYKAMPATNQPNYKKEGKVFVGKLLLTKKDYTIMQRKK